MDDTPPVPAAATPPPATAVARRRSDRLQLVAGLLGAAVTLLASGSALAGGDHRRVMLVTFGAGLAVGLVSVFKYRRATRAPRPPAG